MISKSSGKITKVSNADDVEIKYGHIIQVLTDWIDTTILVSIDGRGMAKSTVIQARRSARCVEEMPGGAFAFVANTYSNLEDNIMPAVQKGCHLYNQHVRKLINHQSRKKISFPEYQSTAGNICDFLTVIPSRLKSSL